MARRRWGSLVAGAIAGISAASIGAYYYLRQAEAQQPPPLPAGRVARVSLSDGWVEAVDESSGLVIASHADDAGVVIRAAADHINRSGAILLDQNVYPVQSQFTIYPGLAIRGTGAGLTVLRSSPLLGVNMVIYNNNGLGIGARTPGFDLSYLTIDHSAASGGACANLSGASNSIVDSCHLIGNQSTFTLFWTGNAGQDVYNNIVAGNVFQGHPDANEDTFGGGVQSNALISGNRWVSGRGSASMAIRLIHDSLITDNVIEQSTSQGIILETGFRNVVQRNTVGNCGGTAIGASASSHGGPFENIFIDNVCGHNGRGISANGSNSVVARNACHDNALAGIEVAGDGTHVYDNECLNNGANTGFVGVQNFRSGIRITNSRDVACTGNVCSNTRADMTQQFGIAEVGTSNFNVIAYNVALNNAIAQFTTVGPNTVFEENVNA